MRIFVIDPQINAQMVDRWPDQLEFFSDVRFLKFQRNGAIRPNRREYFEVVDPDLIRGLEKQHDDMGYLISFPVQGKGFPHVGAAATGFPQQVHELKLRVSGALRDTMRHSPLTVRIRLKMILALLPGDHDAGYNGGYVRRQRNLKPLASLLALIDRRYDELAGKSQCTFMRFFKRVAGQPFASYLNHFRGILRPDLFCPASPQCFGGECAKYKGHRSEAIPIGRTIAFGREAERAVS